MSSVLILGPGVVVPFAHCARIRHPLLRDLADADRNEVQVDPELRETIVQIDRAGAAWEAQRQVSRVSCETSGVSASVSQLDPPRSSAILESVSTETAAAELGKTPQEVRRLLRRGSLHGVREGNAWKVCKADVAARLKGERCPHH